MLYLLSNMRRSGRFAIEGTNDDLALACRITHWVAMRMRSGWLELAKWSPSDHPTCRFSDIGAKSPRSAQYDYWSSDIARGAKPVGEVENPGDVSTTERVDRLIWIANRNDGRPRTHQGFEQGHLKRIGVLILIDEHRPKLAMKGESALW